MIPTRALVAFLSRPLWRLITVEQGRTINDHLCDRQSSSQVNAVNQAVVWVYAPTPLGNLSVAHDLEIGSSWQYS